MTEHEMWVNPEEADEPPGITLTAAQTIALWEFSQRQDCPPYWENREMAAIVDKAKSFHKYGSWL